MKSVHEFAFGPRLDGSIGADFDVDWSAELTLVAVKLESDHEAHLSLYGWLWKSVYRLQTPRETTTWHAVVDVADIYSVLELASPAVELRLFLLTGLLGASLGFQSGVSPSRLCRA
jgi:hypothetical protein